MLKLEVGFRVYSVFRIYHCPPVFIYTDMQSFNCVAEAQCVKLCRYGSRISVHVHIKCQHGPKLWKIDLCDFNCGMGVDTRWAGLRISETADLLGFSRAVHLYTEQVTVGNALLIRQRK